MIVVVFNFKNNVHSQSEVTFQENRKIKVTFEKKIGVFLRAIFFFFEENCNLRKSKKYKV